MIQLTGLTERQVAILDKMWNCDSNEELNDYFRSLSNKERKEALQLKELILIESIDADVAEMQQYSEANSVLVDIMGK